MSLHISSVQNPRIKAVQRLTKRRERDKLSRTTVEGARECLRALQAGIAPVEAYVCPELAQSVDAGEALAQLRQLEAAGRSQLFTVTPALFKRLAYRDESGGLLLVLPYFACTLESLKLPDEPLLLLIENAEKPGNLGAILRTADAAGVDAVLACSSTGSQSCDIHNPNMLRASLGAAFSVPVARCTSSEAIAWLQTHRIALVATSPQASQSYWEARLDRALALALGSEATGLSPELLACADQTVIIPMVGSVDSLNLSTSTALLVYEALRQRRPVGVGGA